MVHTKRVRLHREQFHKGRVVILCVVLGAAIILADVETMFTNFLHCYTL